MFGIWRCKILGVFIVFWHSAITLRGQNELVRIIVKVQIQCQAFNKEVRVIKAKFYSLNFRITSWITELYLAYHTMVYHAWRELSHASSRFAIFQPL